MLDADDGAGNTSLSLLPSLDNWLPAQPDSRAATVSVAARDARETVRSVEIISYWISVVFVEVGCAGTL
jgi:hypothetical protein